MPTSDLILHVIDHLGAGGAQQLLADLVLRLHKRGRRMAVINMRRESDLARSLTQAGMPVISLGLARIDPRQLVVLIRHIRHLRPALVHTHLMGANTIGRLATVLAGVPAMVVHDHESSAEIYTHPGMLLALRRLIEPAAPPQNLRYMVVSQQAAQYAATVARWPEAQICVVPNGIDVTHMLDYHVSPAEARSALGIPQDVPLIGYVGRLRPVKGVDVLLTALAQLPHTHLLVVGTGPQAADLTARAGQSDLMGRIHMLGQVADVRLALRACDVYAQPSRREAFGLAAVEAAAVGLPVVASAVGGLRDIVADGRTGLLVPPDQPAALANALAHLIAHPDEARQMGAAGRDYVCAELSIDRAIERIERVYDELCDIHTMIRNP